MRDWDSNTNHRMQWLFNEVPHKEGDIADGKDFFPATDSFQVDRYPIGAGTLFFHALDWSPILMPWTMAQRVAGMAKMHDDRSPCTAWVGFSHSSPDWRDPLSDAIREMAFSSLTIGSWGVVHLISSGTSPNICDNVAKLHKQIRQRFPALE